MTKQIEFDEESFIPVRARLLAALDGLRTEHPDMLGEHCYRSICRVLLRARLLPPDEKTFERWFRAACRGADGTDYSHSQRAVFVQQFNAVGRRWAEEELTDQPLQATNYRRRRPGGVADPRVYQAIRPSEMHRLQQAFLGRLTQDTKQDSTEEEAHWESFCRLAFAAIVWGGMAWPGALSTLTGLEWQHIRTAVRGFIRIPRGGVWLRLYIPPRVQALALVLGTHLPRPRKFGEPAATQPLLPLGIEEQRRLRMVRCRFNDWLQNLCHAADLRPIRLHTLQEAARLSLARIYGNVLAGAILGLTPYAPVPDGQEHVFETYREPFALPQAPSMPRPALPGSHPPGVESVEHEVGNYRLEGLITRLQDALRPLIAEEADSRTRAATDLEMLARELLGTPLAFAAAREQVDADGFNVAVLAAWLASLCRDRRLKPLTLAAYRSAGSALVRHFAGLRWDELDAETVQEVAALPLTRGTRSRLLTVMGQVVEYLRQDLGIEAISLDQVSVRLRRNLQPINLISQKDVEQILAHLIAKNQEAGGKKQETEARLAHNAFLATLLAYFFGLRRIEMCNLRLGDMLLDAQVPYLRIWFSKRGRSRVVWARYVPPEVLDFLRAEWQRRWEAADSDPAAFFLDYGDDRRALAEMLSKMFNAAIRTLGLEGVGDALPVTLHTLRHACATRQLLMKAQVIEISRSLGHADTDTTTGSYIHAFDYLQRERLNETLAAQQQDGLTATEIGALLGIKRTAVLAELKKLPAADQEGWQRDDRHMYSWSTVVQLLASRLRMSGQR